MSIIDSFFPQLKSFATINENDTITYSNNTIYYTDPNMNQENRSFVNLNDEFHKSFYELDDSLSACLSSPMIFQCNKEVIKLFNDLKLNGLTQNLLEIATVSSQSFFENTSFLELYHDFNEFLSYYNDLIKIAHLKPLATFIELNDTERELYIKEIEIIKEQLHTSHKGEQI